MDSPSDVSSRTLSISPHPQQAGLVDATTCQTRVSPEYDVYSNTIVSPTQSTSWQQQYTPSSSSAASTPPLRTNPIRRRRNQDHSHATNPIQKKTSSAKKSVPEFMDIQDTAMPPIPATTYGRPNRERLEGVPEDLQEALIMLPYDPNIYPGPYAFFREGHEIFAIADAAGSVWFQ